VAAAAAVTTAALPLKLNVVVAIAAAVAIGLLIDHVTPRRSEAAGGRDMKHLADRASRSSAWR
jgi:hypothetical protein